MKHIYFIAVILLFSNSLFANEERKEIGDYNFDGHEDYRVFIIQDGRRSVWDYFLFDPKEGQYNKHESLTDLWNPTFRKKNGTVVTFAVGGHASALFTSDMYVWDSGEIQLMESHIQDWDRKTDLYVNIVMKRISGIMRISKILLLNSEEARAKSIEYFEKI